MRCDVLLACLVMTNLLIGVQDLEERPVGVWLVGEAIANRGHVGDGVLLLHLLLHHMA